MKKIMFFLLLVILSFSCTKEDSKDLIENESIVSIENASELKSNDQAHDKEAKKWDAPSKTFGVSATADLLPPTYSLPTYTVDFKVSWPYSSIDLKIFTRATNSSTWVYRGVAHRISLSPATHTAGFRLQFETGWDNMPYSGGTYFKAFFMGYDESIIPSSSGNWLTSHAFINLEAPINDMNYFYMPYL